MYLQVRCPQISTLWNRVPNLNSGTKAHARTSLYFMPMLFAHGYQLFIVVSLLSHVRLFCDPMDYIACQAPLFMGFPRQEYCSRLPFLHPGIFLTQGWNQCLWHVLQWQVNSLPLSHHSYKLLDLNTKGKDENSSALSLSFNPGEKVGAGQVSPRPPGFRVAHTVSSTFQLRSL